MITPAPCPRRGPPARAARRLLPVLFAILAGCAPAARPPIVSGVGAAARPDDPARAMHRLVNHHRRAIGRSELIWDERLAAVAERHSRDMARRGYFAHRSPEGTDPFERLAAAGIRYRAAAENIAEGPVPPETILEGWLGSRGHRRNLENATYTHHGIGVHRGHWTHVLVREPPRR